MNTDIYYRSILSTKYISRKTNNSIQQKKESQRNNRKQKDFKQKIESRKEKERRKEAPFR